VSVLVVAQSSSEVPEGLMNNSVYYVTILIGSSPCVFCFVSFYWAVRL